MQRRKSIYKKVLIIVFLLNITAILFLSYFQILGSIPDKISIMVGENENFDFNLPLQANFVVDNVDAISINNEKIPSNKINLDLNKPFSIKSTKLGKYVLNVKLFGIFDFKKVELGVINSMELMPSGSPIGIYVETDGVMVLGTGVINGIDGLNYEPALNKLKSGDYITAVNKHTVNTKSDLIDEIQDCDGKDILIDVRRNGATLQYRITPVKTTSNEYKIGTWIRDNTQGIGTLTYTTKNNKFGALGHGITDVNTSLIMEIDQGYLYSADIMTIIKGKSGTPGELIGVINQNDKNKIGNISQNTAQGIFGTVNSKYNVENDKGYLPIGLKQDVELGPATILSCVDNEIKEYKININKIDMSNSDTNKGMVISITDEELLKLTGGIVQGMSGSPIIQNGKLIGAVTHVFIQDSTKGYGTFIENMINNMEE